jgi:hypothetical protein
MVQRLLRGLILYGAGYLGAWAGVLAASLLLIAPPVERQRAERPGEFVCGNPFVPVIILGYLIGGAAGAGCGWWLGGRLFPRPAPRERSPTSA